MELSLPKKKADFITVSVLLMIALLIGGGGIRFPLHEMVIEIIGVLALLRLAAFGWRAPRTSQAACGMAFLALLIFVPVVQIIPLPPELWQNLPGRQLAAMILNAAGFKDRWMPISLDPDATVRAGLSLIPAAALFIGTLHLSTNERYWLIPVVTGAALLTLFIGALQLSGADIYLFETAHRGANVGFFANRNHNGDFLLIAMMLSSVFAARVSGMHPTALPRTVGLAVIILLSLGVIATTSRMALLLLPPTLGISLFALFGWPKATKLSILIPAALLAIGGGFLLLRSAVMERTVTRFQAASEYRFDFWPDVIYAIKQYFPAGSGLGTFNPIFRIDENLANVGIFYVNHAHNDYLEIILETGIVGALLTGIFLVVFVSLSVKALKADKMKSEHTLALGAAAGIAIILLHSIVDYPLRTMAISSLFAVLLGSLFKTADNIIVGSDELGFVDKA